MEAVQQLRAATAADHESVDAAFGAFGFEDRASYARFLTAHARALPAVERALANSDDLPARRGRAELIAADLAALGEPMPDPLPFALGSGAAERFGAAYVIEGSRLGGGLLSKRIATGWPSAYLSATFLPGEWREFLTTLDAKAAGDPAWIADAIASAKATFALYQQAAVAA